MIAKPKGVCRFCGRNRQYCKAHLFPNALRNIAENFKLPKAYLLELSIPKSKGRPIYTLEFDSEIMCAECDNSLSKYDKALAEFYSRYYKHKNRRNQPYYFDKNAEARRISVRCHSDRLLLGFVAILLRCSFSGRETQSNINLGTQMQKKFISWLSNNKIPETDSNEIDIKMIGTFIGGTGLERLLVTTPIHSKNESGDTYRFDLFGLHTTVKVGATPWVGPIAALPSMPKNSVNKIEIVLTRSGNAIDSNYLKQIRNITNVKTVGN